MGKSPSAVPLRRSRGLNRNDTTITRQEIPRSAGSGCVTANSSACSHGLSQNHVLPFTRANSRSVAISHSTCVWIINGTQTAETGRKIIRPYSREFPQGSAKAGTYDGITMSPCLFIMTAHATRIVAALPIPPPRASAFVRTTNKEIPPPRSDPNCRLSVEVDSPARRLSRCLETGDACATHTGSADRGVAPSLGGIGFACSG